jgi:hypothetical protein
MAMPRQTIHVDPSGSSDGRSIIVNPEYTSWYHQDQLVLNVINSSLSEVVLSNVVGAATACEEWSTLERMYASSSRARIMQMGMQLATIQKNELSIADYFNKVKKLADTLAAISKRLESEEFISYLLRDLPSDYDAVVTSITMWADA